MWRQFDWKYSIKFSNNCSKCVRLYTDLSIILCLHSSGENENRTATKNDTAKIKKKHLVDGVTSDMVAMSQGNSWIDLMPHNLASLIYVDSVYLHPSSLKVVRVLDRLESGSGGAVVWLRCQHCGKSCVLIRSFSLVL